jgi:hypothetical protein
LLAAGEKAGIDVPLLGQADAFQRDMACSVASARFSPMT